MRKLLNDSVISYGGYARFAADTNKSETSIRRICKGEASTTLEFAFKISGLLGHTVDELFCDMKTTKPSDTQT